MHKIILIVLLAVVSGRAAAEWVSIGNSPGNGGFETYADLTTIRKSGDMVKMWLLFDYKTPREPVAGVRYLSEKQQAEYDCKGERWRSLYGIWHSENMGNGGVVSPSDYVTPEDWRPVAPGTIAESIWKLACGKR